ncbi:MAG: hypothetical protein R2849_21475 [Thermomicrobiales bacterium]
MRLGQPRNRVAEARTFFFRLADAAGLGTYRRGVRGQSTRLELTANFPDQVRPLIERPSAVAEAEPEESAPVADAQQPPQAISLSTSPATPADGSPTPATISITIDMSDWDLERIEAFLRMIGYPIVE